MTATCSQHGPLCPHLPQNKEPPAPKRTGKCPDCPYKVRLRKNGTIGSHLLYGVCRGNSSTAWVEPPKGAFGMGRFRCEGTGKKPKEGT